MKDKQTMKEIVLTDQELEMIDNIQNRHYPANADDPYKVINCTAVLKFEVQWT